MMRAPRLRRIFRWSIAVALALLPLANPRASGQAAAPHLVAAVLPSSRSAMIGEPVTAFVSVVNAGPVAVDSVGVFLRTPIPATLVFHATDPATNIPTRPPGVPVSLAPGRTQSFAIVLTADAPFAPTIVEFDFAPLGADRVTAIPGVNTLLLSASAAPAPDIVALGVTASRDGTLHASVSGALATARATVTGRLLPRASHRGAFAVAVVNAGGASDVITATARITGSTTPVATVRETDTATGAVIGGDTRHLAPGQTATFGVFVAAPQAVAFEPGRNRVVVEFIDSAGIIRGSTSVALSTRRGELIARGAELFFRERFEGNGRTCATCHPADNRFTLDAAFIATLLPDDPLFVAETNPQLASLEHPRLLREFALVLENVDGFERPGVLRGVPHTLGLATSIRSNGGPRTGWSGDGAPGDGSLRSFATGAVTQHFTRRLDRVPGVDFRLPTADELEALEAFQLALGRQADLKLPLPLTGTRARNGQAIFLDDGLGRCNVCHVNAGATANLGAGSLGNENFDTGVERFVPVPPRPVSETIPVDGGAGTFPRPLGGFGNGRFNTPSLVEAASTPPFFHNNSVATIEEAVAFYTSPEFSASSGAIDAGGPITLTPVQIEDVAAFLRVINAIESLRASDEMLDDAAAARSEPALVARLVELADLAVADAARVLDEAALHADAVALLGEARTALARRSIGIAKAKLTEARDRLIDR